jgi:MFS family permease
LPSPILKLIGITSASQVAGINGGLAIWNLVTTLIAAQFVERIGRRPLWITGSIGVLCSFAVVTGLSVCAPYHVVTVELIL